MSRRKRIILISVLLVLLILIASFSLYWFYYRRIELERIAQAERIEIIEQEMRARQEMRERRLQQVEQEREEQAADIFEFHIEYTDIRNEFLKEIGEISAQMQARAENIEEIKGLTAERAEASKSYKQSLEAVYMPQPLIIFHDLKINFLDHDLETWSLINSYYSSMRYSTYDTGEINRMYELNMQLFKEAEEELARVYEKYELDDLWDDLT